MSDFPTLRTGAVMQYPAERATVFSTQVVRFLGGAEQRFPDYGSPLHRWAIRLSLLEEGELHALREFFRTQRGASGTFAFTDPSDGAAYPHCSLENGEMADQLLDGAKGKTALIVRENRG